MNRISSTHFNPSIRFCPFFFFCGHLMLISEIWKQYCLTFLINGGSFNWWYFPFQLCSTPMYILLVLPYIKKERISNACLTFLMSFGLLGGIAVFADTTGLHYPMPALTIHSYTWHILLIIIGGFAAAARFSGKSRKTGACPSAVHSFGDAALLYIVFCVIAACINHICGNFGTINMFYINPQYPMEQIVFCELVPYLGNIPVILLYIAMTVFGAGILFFFWCFMLVRWNS